MGSYSDQNEAGAPARVAHENLEVDPQNPNIVRAIPPEQTADSTSPMSDEGEYEGIIEGSDSERTGTSWGLPGREDAGEGADEAHPNRNTGDRLTQDDIKAVGSWSTIDTDDNAGSPSGSS